MVIRWKLKKLVAGLLGLYALNIRKNPTNFFPPTLSIKLTDRCNYHCITCNHYQMGDKRSELTLQQWQYVLRDFKEMGGFSVRFTGGEPLLRKDIDSLVSYAKSLGLRVSIATNGSLLTEEQVGLFRKESVGRVTISMHGKEETHDSIVGIKGSWKKLDSIIRHMRRIELPVGIAFTIIKRNIGEIEAIVKYAKDLDIAVEFNIFHNNLYFSQGIDSSIGPSVEEMRGATNLLIELKRKYPEHIAGSIKGFREIPMLLQDSRLPHYYCARTLMGLFIDSLGNVYPGCWAMSPAGRLNHDTLFDIFRSQDYVEKRVKGFNKECPGCTCGYEMDVLMNIRRRA